MQLLVWLYHNVWGNLVASAICTTIAYIKIHAKQKKHHQDMKDHIDAHFQKLTEGTNQ